LAGTKYICTLQGIDVGTVRCPFRPLTEEAQKHIEEVYEKNINI
jgi:dihydrodipicolinate synthase/N-acetylneuraminate lyase